MSTTNLRFPLVTRPLLVAGALLIATPNTARAEQTPGTNAPTPPPPPAASDPVMPTTTTTTTTGLQEPVIDATTRRSSLPNKPLLVTGLVVLGSSYGASAIGAAISDREYQDKLYYPVAGPWLALEDRDCSAEPCPRKTLETTLLIGSGVLQGIGALSLVMSLFVPEKTTQQWYLIGNEDLTVAPVAGGSTVGASAFGRF